MPCTRSMPEMLRTWRTVFISPELATAGEDDQPFGRFEPHRQIVVDRVGAISVLVEKERAAGVLEGCHARHRAGDADACTQIAGSVEFDPAARRKSGQRVRRSAVMPIGLDSCPVWRLKRPNVAPFP